MQGLTDAMMNAAEDRRYEEAAVLRDRISLLRDVMHQQAVETTGGDTDADIIAVLIKTVPSVSTWPWCEEGVILEITPISRILRAVWVTISPKVKCLKLSSRITTATFPFRMR